MSFTLYREKNGERVPIRLSVFDAFRSPSASQSRPINKTSANTTKKITSVQSSGTKAKQKAPENKPSNPHSTSEPETWSEEDDAKLIEMKAANKSWKEIGAALGKRSKSGMTDRWKAIGPKSEEEKKKEQESKARAENKKAEGMAKADQKKKKQQEEEGQDQKDDQKKNESASSETSMIAFAARYDKDKWLAVASKHYDMTGQRISVEKAKKMFEKK